MQNMTPRSVHLQQQYHLWQIDRQAQEVTTEMLCDLGAWQKCQLKKGICDQGDTAQKVINTCAISVLDLVKMWVRLLAKTPETQSSLGHGTWPQLTCCALVAVWVQEVRLEHWSKGVAQMMIKTVNDEEGTNSRCWG